MTLSSLNRRALLAALSAAAAGPALASVPTKPTAPGGRRLQFRPDGQFKILAISDLHYTPQPDLDGMALTEKLIGLEKPDLVIACGDNISGDSCFTLEDVAKATANVGRVMEQMKVPWAVVLGNHDNEHFPKTGMSRDQAFRLYESYPYNMNGGWVQGQSGVGDKNLLLWNAAGTKPVADIWLMDSGAKAEDPSERYQWFHADQTYWYWKASQELEKTWGGKVPGLMFFHIPLPEFREMVMTRKVIGERHEPESPSSINGGLFGALLDRKDVMGVFCGHDHVNNYMGRFHGVNLGQVGVVGSRGYPHTPPSDPTNDRARGGRVLLLDEAKPGKFKTWMRFKDGSANWESWSDAYVEAEQK
ncbi:metallophosphoesterase family protein [Caulobacter sp.]|uniref:metallophosphoesterase family protein n=1 Tax=Caulobacter sp. TaxID=78 RepID=UPI002B4A3740|nr:metallophosphoesterase family protein [Caulobacter sp.]HJV43520.1 metallophosphoesterase family protein [Caulobacter sp.]